MDAPARWQAIAPASDEPGEQRSAPGSKKRRQAVAVACVQCRSGKAKVSPRLDKLPEKDKYSSILSVTEFAPDVRAVQTMILPVSTMWRRVSLELSV